jgi:hypothetical protein
MMLAAIVAAKSVDEFTASFAIILTTVWFEIELVFGPCGRERFGSQRSQTGRVAMEALKG